MSTPPARAQACVAQVSTWACVDQGQPRSPGRPLAHALGLATPACREQGACRPPGGTAGAGSWGAGRGGSRAGKPPSRGQNSSAVQAAICSWRRVTFLSAVTSLPRRHSFAFEVSLARPTRSLCECSSQGSHRPFTGNLRLKTSRGRRPRTHLRTSPAMPVGLGDPLCSRSPHSLRCLTLPGGDRPHCPGKLRTRRPGTRQFSQGLGRSASAPQACPVASPAVQPAAPGPCTPHGSVGARSRCVPPLPRSAKGGDRAHG